ncbi:uncharacterized protein LOC119736839 [Patiria miniata]|uniref:Uncharacterized protein n=1 Tax=Patiria miniata TaxID=46514 RepID=A0A914ATY0_PATMI|nr:uncharacterized protein LOC119736839 [Patiria miniata]
MLDEAMAVQIVDLFAPGWISTKEATSTPMSSSSYAGRLVGRPEGSTNNNAQTAQDRDEKLLKRTSLKYARNATKKTRPYCRDVQLGIGFRCLFLRQHYPTDPAERGPRDTDVDVMSFYDDHGEFSIRFEGEPPGDESQPSWIRQEDLLMKNTGKEVESDKTPVSVGRNKTKSKAVKTWRRQVKGLQDKDDDSAAQKFAPIWMKKKALHSSSGENVDELQTSVPVPQSLLDTDACHVARTPERSESSNVTANPLVAIPPDEEPEQARSKSKDRFEETGRPNTEAHKSSSTKSLEVGNINVSDNDSREAGCMQDKGSSSNKIESQDSYGRSDFTSSSSDFGSCDSQPKSPVLTNGPECVNVPPEGQVNGLIFRVLLTAVVTLLVEDVIEDSIREIEDEILEELETLDLLDLSNLSTDESCFQSDGLNYQDQTWSDFEVYESPSGSKRPVEALMTDETPPWDSENAFLGEESFINACLEEDAQENGYAASVAVMDGGEAEGFMTDVVLLWTLEGDSFNTSGDSSVPSPGFDEDVSDFGDRGERSCIDKVRACRA